jgi:hypothetical protein
MNTAQIELANLRVRRWTVRAIGFGIITVAGCAWMTRNDTPFLPAFALQTLAAFYFVALILGAIWLGFVVGDLVGKLNAVLGFIIGFVVAAAAFFFGGIFSTELPILGPPLERFVSLIE